LCPEFNLSKGWNAVLKMEDIAGVRIDCGGRAKRLSVPYREQWLTFRKRPPGVVFKPVHAATARKGSCGERCI